MNQKLINFILLFLPIVPFQAHAQQVLGAEEAWRIALENNFSIQIAKNDEQVGRNNNSLGNAGMLPTVNGVLNQDNTVTNTKQTFLNGSSNDRNGAKADQLNAAVELGWTIFDGFKMFATKGRFEQLQQQGELRVRMQMEQVFLRLMKGYFDLVLATRLLKLEEETDQLSTLRLKLAEDRFQAGKASKAELLNARVDRDTDKARLLRQKNQLELLKTQLNQLMGRDLKLDFQVDTVIQFRKELALADLEQHTLSGNTSLRMLKSAEAVNYYQLKEIQAERMPSITVKGGYNYSRSNSEAGFLQRASNLGYHYGAGVNLNIFNGNSVGRRIENARLGIKNAELIYKDSSSKVLQALYQQFRVYKTSIELIELEKNRVETARLNVEIAVEQYRQGVISALEFRQSQQNLLQAENSFLQASYEGLMSELELKRISGGLFN
ncbi:MAG: TolC family protein [Bacteroidetes bacterium]|nr:TolC family protein [Bacteroidota bacterium]